MTVTPTLLLLAAVAAAAGQPIQQPQQAWALTLDDPGSIVLSTWSPTGTCVAVATGTTVHVIDPAGRALWKWTFRATNRLIRVTDTLAVSPACDAVAVGGSPAYKYVWTADRRGTHVFFKTTGTPLAVKFSLRGDVLAVSTGAGVGYLLSPRLAIRWSGNIGDLPVKWPSQILDATAPSHEEFTREDIAWIFAVPWGELGHRDSISDDGQWRVFFTHPYRGDLSAGTVELWGPGAEGYQRRFNDDANRQPRWRKPFGCTEATVTRDGMFVVVIGDIEHNDPTCANLATHVFDREGNTVLTLPYEGLVDEDEMSQAVFTRTGLRLVFPTQPSWDVPLTPEERSTLPDTRRRLTNSPDGRMLLITRDRNVRMYRAPD